MFRVALASVLGNKIRLALTALAIVLGVAFVAGSFVLTDSIDRAFTGLLERPLAEAAAAPFGYLPSAGTSWFVTLVLQLVVAFPALEWLQRRLGVVATLVLGAAATVACHLAMIPLIGAIKSCILDTADGPGFYYFWIFWPADLWLVFAGMALAGALRLPRKLVVAAAAVFVAGALVHARVVEDPFVRTGLQRILDVPLAVVLLAALPAVGRLPSLAAALAWLGRWSWGLYLAHILVHEVVHAFGYFPEEEGLAVRSAYFAVLLGSAVVIAVVSERARDAATAAATR